MLPNSVPPAQNDRHIAESSQYELCSWRVAGAAVTGVTHQRLGLPCQDFQSHRILPAGRGTALLVALADGAGSAEHAQLGAERVVLAVLDALEHCLRGECSAPLDLDSMIRQAFEAARQALVTLAEQDGLAIRSLATTLTCALVVDGFLGVGQVGDGSLVVQTAQGELLALTQPQRGEYANETYFLSQEDALEHLQVQVLHQPIEALAVLSDGLLRLALQVASNQPHGPFFNPLFDFVASMANPELAAEQLAAFLASERVSARTDDDKSIVLAVCLGAGTGSPGAGGAGG